MAKHLLVFFTGWVAICSCGHPPPETKVSADSPAASGGKVSPDRALSAKVDSVGQKLRANLAKKRHDWKLIDSFVTNLNDDAIPDTLRLYSSTGNISSFDSISISLSGFEQKGFHTPEPWSRSDDWPTFTPDNALPTDKLFLGRGKHQSVLLLSDEISAAGYRESFNIINIEGNRIQLVLDQNERHLYIESPIALTDMDGDGRLEFLYRQIFEYNGKPDTLDGKVGTYSPYFVFTVDSNCVLNKRLTIQYNQEHYVFAGFKYDENIEVFYPNDTTKRPRLWKK